MRIHEDAFGAVLRRTTQSYTSALSLRALISLFTMARESTVRALRVEGNFMFLSLIHI